MKILGRQILCQHRKLKVRKKWGIHEGQISQKSLTFTTEITGQWVSVRFVHIWWCSEQGWAFQPPSQFISSSYLFDNKLNSTPLKWPNRYDIPIALLWSYSEKFGLIFFFLFIFFCFRFSWSSCFLSMLFRNLLVCCDLMMEVNSSQMP